MQGIEIPIGAPLGQLDKDLKGANAKLKAFASEASKTSAVLGGSVAKGADQAGFALTNLGRVAQDAPFGFIGIQNNLNPLLESFGRLKQETGSTGGALKALGQSLIGPAGLGFALSVVSAGILVYQQYQQRANKETKAATDANKELKDSILSISDVQAEGRKNASGELSQLQSLYNATQNANVPNKERLKIAEDLIKRYPQYLDGLSAEQILAGKAAAEYNKLTNAILAKGYAQAAEENRQKLINQQLNAKVELTKEQSKLDKLSAELSKRTAQKQATLDIQGQAALEKGISRTAGAIDDSKNKINEYNQILKNSSNEIKILDDVTQGLIKTYGAEVILDPEKPKKLTSNIKTQAEILKQLQIDLQKVNNSVDITFGKGNEQKVSAFAKAIDGLTEIGAGKTIISKLQQDLLNVQNVDVEGAKQLGVNVATALGSGLASAGPVIAQNLSTPLKTGLTDWQLYVNNELLPKIQSNFETFFNNILMTGKFSFDALGKAVLNTFLSIIASDAARQVTNLLKTTQGTDYSDSKKPGQGPGLLGGVGKLIGGLLGGKDGGVATKGLGKFLGKALPVAGLAIGAASILGSLFKKKDTPVPQASSTISTSAASSFTDFGGGRVVFEISGTNLIGVLNRAGAKLQRYGG